MNLPTVPSKVLVLSRLASRSSRLNKSKWLTVLAAAACLLGTCSASAQFAPTFAWAQRAGSTIPDEANAVAVDPVGNIYVAGWFGTNASFGNTILPGSATYDLFLTKLNPSGQFLWAKNLHAGASSLTAYRLKFDHAGNLIIMAPVVGEFAGDSLTKMFLAKVDVNGSVIWTKVVNSGFLATVTGGALAVDASDNIYVTGIFSGTANFGAIQVTSTGYGDLFLAKFGSNGAIQAVKTIGQPAGPDDEGRGVAVDGSGNVYVAGQFGGTITLAGTSLTSAGGTDVLLVKYNSSLVPVWAKAVGSAGDDNSFGLVLDASGAAYLLGKVAGDTTFGSAAIYTGRDNYFFLAKVDGNGNFLWASPLAPVPESFFLDNSSGCYGLTIDNSGSVLVTGRGYIGQFTSGGSRAWTRGYPSFNIENVNDVAAYAGTNLYVVGRYQDAATLDSFTLEPIGLGDIFIAKLQATVAQSPSITVQPVSQTVTEGSNVTFTVSATGSAPISYQWRHDGVDIFGQTGTNLTILSASTSSAGTYTVVVSNAAGSVTSSGATLTVKLIAPSITFQPASQTVAAGSDVTFVVGAYGSTPWTVQWQRFSTNLPGANGVALQLLSVTTNQAGPYRAIVTNAAGSATTDVATLIVTQAVVLAPVITQQPLSQTVTAGSNVSFSVLVSGTSPFIYQWRKNGNNIAGAAASSYSIAGAQAADAGTYTVVVTNSAGTATSTPATLTVNPLLLAPSITQQPVARSVPIGGSVSFSVVATGTAPLVYQWLHNGVNIAGAVTNTYSIGFVQTNHAGTYSVVVSNSLGRVTSSPALLTVLPALSAPNIEPSFLLGVGFNSWVNVLAVQGDGLLVAGGLFTSFNNLARPYIARLNLDGSLDASFNPGVGPNGALVGLALQPDGKVLIGGFFTSVAGTARSHIARLNSNGSLDLSFDPGIGTANNVAPIALQADGKIVFGGDFTNFSGVACGRIARLNSDGRLDATFQPGTGADSEVKAIKIQADGKILVGGAFGKFNGVSRVSIARLNSDGTLDSTFNPGGGALFWVNAIALQPDGKILIGGPFTTFNGVARKGVARLLSNGTLDTTFNPGTGANNWVNAIAVQADGKIVIGGIFTNFNGAPANHLARLNADGGTDASFDIASGLNDTVQCAVAPLDGTIVAGGLFTSVNGIACGRIARFIGLTGSPMPAIKAQPGLQGVLLSWPTYGANWALQVTRDLSLPFQPSGISIAVTNGISYGTALGAAADQFFRLKHQP